MTMATNPLQVDTPNRRPGAILAFLALAAAVLCAPAGAAAAQEPTEVPETIDETTVKTASGVPLEAADAVHDFGTVVKGDHVTHTFVLRNTGDEAITVAGVAPSCGCTVAEFDREIPAGGEGTVQAELDTLSLTGKSSSMLGVFVEGHEDPAVVLTLEAEVINKLFAHPGYARWIYVQHEEEGTIEQTVYSNDGAEFEVVSVEPPIPAVDVSFREAKPEERQEKAKGSQWLVSATLDSRAPVGPVSGFITVHTTHPQQKVMQIPVSGFVRPAVFVEPQKGEFGRLELAAPRHATFQVRTFSSEPIHLTDAEADIPGVSAIIDTVEDGRTYNVVVVFDPASMREGRFEGELKLTTDSDKVPAVTVDLTGTLVRPEDGASR